LAEWKLEDAAEEGLKKGLEQGLEKGLEKAVKVLLANTEFSVEKIASEVGVSISFVENVKNKLQPK
jgi:flagellar biosynthesis/type III secretory pathway protein FliH